MTKAKRPAPSRRTARSKAAAAPADTADIADTESRILAAARVVFTRSGTAGARMQDIAREAGVNQALLHYYFRSKQALADRVFREAAAGLFAALPRTIRPDASLEDVLRDFIHAYIDTTRRTPFVPPYVAAEVHQHPERVVQVIRELSGRDPRDESPRLLVTVQAMIDARVRAGEMRPISADQLVVNTMALLAFPFVARALLAGVHGMDDAAFERFLDERRDDLPRFILNAVRP
jgi:AcrR family transcriptional regulator